MQEEYLLRYFLNTETAGSPSLLNIDQFLEPDQYKMKIKKPGSDETEEKRIDLLETFNYLIGLVVDSISVPNYYSPKLEHSQDGRIIVADKRMRVQSEGKWWFRTVEGKTLDGRKVFIIWRNRPGGETPDGMAEDNAVLDKWFQLNQFSSKDSEFDIIYVNGTNNLENLKSPDDLWKVRLIEETFRQKMFAE